MAIAFRSVGKFGGASANSVIVPAPAGIQDNDALVAVVLTNSNITITPPAGWTTIAVVACGGAFAGTFIKRAASESGNYTFTTTGSSIGVGIVAAYTGVSTTTLQDAAAITAAQVSASNIDAASITTVTAGALLITCYAGVANGSWSQPTGMTERADQNDGVIITAAMDDQLIAAAGATGVRNAAISAGVNPDLRAFTIALRPEPITGTAAGTFPAFTGAAVGVMLPTGGAAGSFPALTGAAVGTQTQRGTAAGSFPAMTGLAAAAQSQSGSAAGAFPAMTGAATGREIDPAAIITLPGASSESLTVTAALTDAATLPASTGARGTLRAQG